jgi:ABC-type nitrate/sulfonate/bicarbonate transport system substrate-binding protein
MKSRLILTAIAALAVLACQPSTATPRAAPAPAAAPAAGAPASPAPLVPVNMAQIYTAGSMLPYWLALDAGYFREQGLDVQTVVMQGSILGMQSLVAGDVQFVLSAPTPPTIGAVLQEPDVTILGSIGNRLQYVWEGNVRTPAELRGKRLAISRPGDSSHDLQVKALHKFGLSENDVQWVNVGGIPERLAALISGQVDATLITVPGNLQAQKAGAFYDIADLGELGIEYIGTSAYARRSWAQQHASTAQGFLKGLMKANAVIPRDAELAKATLKKYLELNDADELEAVYRDTARSVEPALTPSLTGLQAVIESTVPQNPAAATLRAEQLVEPSHLQAIEASGFRTRLQQ